MIMHWDDDEGDVLHYLELDEEGISETKSLALGETLSHEEAVDLIRGLTTGQTAIYTPPGPPERRAFFLRTEAGAHAAAAICRPFRAPGYRHIQYLGLTPQAMDLSRLRRSIASPTSRTRSPERLA
jgi:hypothetical protein